MEFSFVSSCTSPLIATTNSDAVSASIKANNIANLSLFLKPFAQRVQIDQGRLLAGVL
jgi:hypothetical protein